jgi:cupin 2 domain-containing protein
MGAWNRNKFVHQQSEGFRAMLPANLLHPLPAPQANENTAILARGDGMRIERIVSHGHCSPAGFWYEQEENEWVSVLSGAARLRFADGRTLDMKPGDQVDIPAGQRHRVEWTASDVPTVWLAVFYRPNPGGASEAR